MAKSVAFVTGGASGLGEAALRKLVAEGYNAVIFDLNQQRGEEVARELQTLYPNTTVRVFSGDVASEKDVQLAIDGATEIGELRVVVNCAGIAHAIRTINRKGEPMDLPSFQRVININLVGTFNVTRLAAKAMVLKTPPKGADKDRGVVINIASVAAFDGQIGQVAYSASKGGVVGMTLPLARDLSDFGIRVLCVAPGVMLTPMVELMPENVRDGLASDVPYPHRLGKPEEFANLIHHCAVNSYLNGETIRLDGALRMPPRSSIAPPAPKAKL